MLSQADILTALRDCFDPEFKINVVDLGLIDRIDLEPDPDSTPRWPRQRAKIVMTLPTADAPANGMVVEQVQNRLAGIPDLARVDVELVWEPKWTRDRITPAGRLQLRS